MIVRFLRFGFVEQCDRRDPSYYIAIHLELPCELFAAPRRCSDPFIDCFMSRTSVFDAFLRLGHIAETRS